MQTNVQTSAQTDEEARGVLVLAMYGNTEGCGRCSGVVHPPLGLPEAGMAPSVAVSPVCSQVCVQSARLICQDSTGINLTPLSAASPNCLYHECNGENLWFQTSAPGVSLKCGSWRRLNSAVFSGGFCHRPFFTTATVIWCDSVR